MSKEEKPVSQQEGVTPLTKRKIEIELANAFVNVIVAEYGETVAKDILHKVVLKEAIHAANGFRERFSEPTLAHLFEVWNILGGDGRLDLELDELTEHTLRFHINHCQYAEAYKALHLEEIGIMFSCQRDEPFAKAFLPGVQVKQSQTILEGSPRCCFEYTLEKK